MATAIETSTALIEHHLSIAGKLIVNATACDVILYSAFKVISDCKSKIANAIYFSSETLNVKRNFITRILRVNDDKKVTKIVERIIAATEKATNQRNELSHALIQVSGDKLLRVNPRHQGQSGKPITGSFLDGLLRHSTRAHIDALRAFHELCLKRGIPPSITHE